MAITRAFTNSQLDSRVDFYYTATSGQTTFSGSDDNGSTLSYTASGAKDVYLNGTLLIESDDYVATNGTSVVLQATTQAGDIVHISVNKVMSSLVNLVDTTVDLNGNELILDADGDTSITADTDDQIDIKIAGADDFKFTANGFNVLSGSTLTIDSGATITNNGTASGFGALVKLAGETLSSDVSSIEFSTSVITTTYKTYILYSRLQPKTDGARVIVRLRDDSGILLANVSAYQSQIYRGGGTDFSDTSTSSIYPVSSSGNATGEYAFYRHEFSEPRATDKQTTFLVHGTNVTSAGDIAMVQGGGLLSVAEDNQGMRVSFDSGDIASGSSYVLFGVKE